jgi:hypothetical protein
VTEPEQFPWEGLTGSTLLADDARTVLLCQKTPALFTCSDPRCPHSCRTWEAELPSITWDSPRAWPKCPSPKRHRAKLIEIVDPSRHGRG